MRPGELFASLKDVTQAADLLGSVARLPSDSLTGRLTQDTVRLDFISQDVLPAFLYWSLQAPGYRAYCRAHATGTTNLGLPRNDFLAFPVWVPSYEEQRQIAGVLGALDDLINTNAELQDSLWVLARASYDRVQDEPMVRVRLGEILDLKYGKALPTPSRVPGPVSVVSSAGIIDTHIEKLASGPGVVVGRKGSVGTVTWVPGDFFAIDTAYFVDSHLLPPLWSYFLLTCLPLGGMNTDSAVPGLNRSNALGLEVSRPTNGILEAFTQVTAPLMEAVEALALEIQGLRRTRDELLPLLMSGKVRVGDIAGIGVEGDE